MALTGSQKAVVKREVHKASNAMYKEIVRGYDVGNEDLLEVLTEICGDMLDELIDRGIVDTQ